MPPIDPAADALEIVDYENEGGNPSVRVWWLERALSDFSFFWLISIPLERMHLQKCQEQFEHRADDMKNWLSVGEKPETHKHKDKKHCETGLYQGQLPRTL